ncbi:MAG: hypothetical protein JETT_1593 [Candidatus Jettenia ecosi]|uniref:Uncharacterized protein n=1 Tax=Candidatus Jettenia ecosi TaxID=2494326 RepID=A0A533QBL9_9BACT|nr:MAG: hypothetical protein JETT_1593 [Candidatus Jettenia ecosi]
MASAIILKRTFIEIKKPVPSYEKRRVQMTNRNASPPLLRRSFSAKHDRQVF